MEQGEEYAVLIANYLEGLMSLEEQMAFMEDLGRSEALREQYEDTLLVEALLEPRQPFAAVSKKVMLQPVDDHLAMINAALETKKKPPVFNIFDKYRAIAAVFIIAVAATAIYMALRPGSTGSPQTGIVKGGMMPGDSSMKKQEAQGRATISNNPQAPTLKDSGKTPSPGALAVNEKIRKIESSFFSDYRAAGNDPPETQEVLDDLQSRKFSTVIAATDDDYLLRGADNRNNLIKQYMHLYKGLAYNAVNKPEMAVTEFRAILNSGENTTPQYYDAQWYMVKALLTVGRQSEAVNTLQKIAESNSPYKAQGAKVVDALNK